MVLFVEAMYPTLEDVANALKGIEHMKPGETCTKLLTSFVDGTRHMLVEQGDRKGLKELDKEVPEKMPSSLVKCGVFMNKCMAQCKEEHPGKDKKLSRKEIHQLQGDKFSKLVLVATNTVHGKCYVAECVLTVL